MLKKFLAFMAAFVAVAAFAAVDVNKATEAELDSIKGIGPVTSKLILSERKKGAFKSWEDFIERVKGVGDDRATSFSKAGLTVGGASYMKMASDKTMAEKTKETTAKAVDKTKEVAKNTAEKTKEVAEKAVDKTKEVAKNTKDKVTNKN